jgi:hypothetical protein
MSKSDRKVSVRAVLSASVLIAGACAVTTASASDGAQPKGASCVEETRKVVVWPAGSGKSNQFGRVENHVVTVCDGKVISSKPVRNAEPKTPAAHRDGA